MEQIIVNVDVDGSVKVEAQGVAGQSCQDLTRAIEQAIGRTVGDQKKPEFYGREQSHARAGGTTGGR